MNKIALSSLAMDLKRAALGFYRGSDVMAERFVKEALKREKEINFKSTRPYIKNICGKLKKCLAKKDKKDAAEDLLMYSALFQNSVLT
jgi:hypothetical protein